jgi:hypothetical protein
MRVDREQLSGLPPALAQTFSLSEDPSSRAHVLFCVIGSTYSEEIIG